VDTPTQKNSCFKTLKIQKLYRIKNFYALAVSSIQSTASIYFWPPQTIKLGSNGFFAQKSNHYDAKHLTQYRKKNGFLYLNQCISAENIGTSGHTQPGRQFL